MIACLHDFLFALSQQKKTSYNGVQEPQASTDINGYDNDPQPRYDPSNENKYKWLRIDSIFLQVS